MFDDVFDDTYKRMYYEAHKKYDKYDLGLKEGKGVVEKLVEICTIEELQNLKNMMKDILSRKGRISSMWSMPEEIRMLRYSYHNLNGINTGNIHTKRDYRRMADDIQRAIDIKENIIKEK